MKALTATVCPSTYLLEMMKRLGIDPGGGVVPKLSPSYAIAFHRCEACQSKRSCRDWLDTISVSLPLAPRFCPNADILFELQVDPFVCSRTKSLIGSQNRFKGCRL
jgi:hypothetical protein